MRFQTRSRYSSLLAFLTAVLLPLAVTTSSAAQSVEGELEGIYNYTRIGDDLVSAGQVAYDQIELLKQGGFDVVVNLATANEGSNALEGFLVAQQGLTYVHIPVPFSDPPMRDLEMFFAVMEMNKDRNVFVHCAANMRASAFVFLYRTLVQNVPEDVAREDMLKIWDPDESEAWGNLLKTAKVQLGSK